jgi:hypothetical protein
MDEKKHCNYKLMEVEAATNAVEAGLEFLALTGLY